MGKVFYLNEIHQTFNAVYNTHIDQPPIIHNDRAIFETLGATVEWDGEKKHVPVKNTNVTQIIYCKQKRKG